MVISIPDPYDFHLSTVRFRDFGSDGATVWHEDGLHRVIRGQEVRIEAALGGVRVDPFNAESAEEVSRLLGLPFALDPFRTWAAGDRIMGPITTALAGFRPTLNPRPFEALVVAITTQQISLQAAAAIRGRFVQRFGLKHGIAWEFPSREAVALADPREFPALGFSQKKAEYVIELARSELEFDALALLPDHEVIAALTALPGLGRWTADWFLARHLARPHAWPAGDLGVRKAVSAFYADGRPLTIPEVRAMSDRFSPFQNLSAQFLLAAARMAG
ncbi:MAG: DNA-3-methyladenine glycosylase 2 family protein [Actinobacteria bacterium]|nr:DNA-3-methyladenine glycosylase 2 family protein [Actinomycetota bacterium]